MGGGCCICLALCICISICCCCYHKKRTASTATNTTTSTTAIPMNSVQPAPVATMNQLTAVQETMAGQQDNKPPLEYKPGYDPTPKALCTSYTVTHTKSSPGGTPPPSCLPAAHNLPQGSVYPSTGDGTPPPAYPAPGGTLPAGYLLQQQHSAQSPADLPPPYPEPSPLYPLQ